MKGHLARVLTGALLASGLWAAAGCSGDALPPLELALDAHWPRSPLIEGGLRGRAVLTNSLEDTLSVFPAQVEDPRSFNELVRAPVGLSPVMLEGVHHAVVSPSGERLYVGLSQYVPGGGSGPHGAHGTGTADGYVLALRTSDGALDRWVRVDRNPGDLTLTPDGRYLLVSHYDVLRIEEALASGADERAMDARLVIIDTETMTRVAAVPSCPAPHGVQAAPDGRRAYLACRSDELAVVELVQEGFPVQRLKLPGGGGAVAPVHEPYALAVSPDGRQVWLSAIGSKELVVVDTESLTVVRSIPVGGAPYFGAFSADGSRFYAPVQGLDALLTVEVAGGVILDSLRLRSLSCTNLHQVALASDSPQAFVVCEGNHRSPGAAVVVDLETRTVLTTAPAGVFPDAVAFVPTSP